LTEPEAVAGGVQVRVNVFVLANPWTTGTTFVPRLLLVPAVQLPAAVFVLLAKRAVSSYPNLGPSGSFIVTVRGIGVPGV